MQSLCPSDVWPSPSQVSSTPVPRDFARFTAPAYGVAGSCRLPTTRIGLDPAAVSGGIGWRFFCQVWHWNSDDADHSPNSGNCVAHREAACLISASLGSLRWSLQLTVWKTS